MGDTQYQFRDYFFPSRFFMERHFYGTPACKISRASGLRRGNAGWIDGRRRPSGPTSRQPARTESDRHARPYTGTSANRPTDRTKPNPFRPPPAGDSWKPASVVGQRNAQLIYWLALLLDRRRWRNVRCLMAL